MDIKYIPGFLKTGLGKISTHSTTWQFKTTKLIQRPIKVTRPSFLGRVPSYFEALLYPHLYFYRKSNT